MQDHEQRGFGWMLTLKLGVSLQLDRKALFVRAYYPSPHGELRRPSPRQTVIYLIHVNIQTVTRGGKLGRYNSKGQFHLVIAAWEMRP